MRVRKIINWPLTLFTLLSIVIICILGLSLAQTAFFTAWGREHIAYNSNVEMVKSNLDNELQNKIANVDGFKEVVEAGACVDEKGLVQLFQSVISQGEWDVYGFVGTTRKVFTKDGILLNAGEMETLDEVLDKHPENDVFWGEDSYAEYLFFPEEVVVGGNPIRLFFAVNMNALLQELTIKDGIDGNPVCLINESGEVLSSVDLEDTFDYGTLKATDFYNNPSNKVNSQYLRSIMDSYISKDSKFIIVYLASGEDGKQHSYAATITDDDTEEPIQTEIQSDEVAEASTMTEALESYSVNFGGFMWYEKPLSFSNAGMMKLLLGKPKEISGGMLQSSLYIMTMYAVVVIILFIMFIMQIIFTVHSNRKLYKVAYIDPITKVRNWTRFVLDAKRLIKKRKNRKYAMVMFDIDKFNVYNDLYGHGEGDILLSQVAKYLNKHMRKKEIFTRCGADHFTLLIYWESEQELDERINGIRNDLTETFSGRSVQFTIGAYKVMDYTMSVDRMYTFTSIAQESAKHHRDAGIAYFSDEQRQKLLRDKELENLMVSALKKKEFQVYLQPKYYSDGSRIGGAEALVRWVSPEMGFISPGDFIPLFESNGFIIQLDNYMVNEVCELQKRWCDAGRELITISVNISRVHLMDPHLVTDVQQIVDSYGLPHSCIELELTESAFFDAKDVLIRTIKEFQNLGFEISMDDFGSGYSSLNSLKDLPLDVIKLDGEFFKETEDKERSSRIVTDTVKLAKNLNMRIVAEGIEKKEQVDFLQEIGCDLIQGFYFARPMPVQDFEKIWENQQEINETKGNAE